MTAIVLLSQQMIRHCSVVQIKTSVHQPGSVSRLIIVWPMSCVKFLSATFVYHELPLVSKESPGKYCGPKSLAFNMPCKLVNKEILKYSFQLLL